MGTRAGLWIDRSLKLLPFYAAYVVVKVYLEPCDDEPRKLVFPQSELSTWDLIKTYVE